MGYTNIPSISLSKQPVRTTITIPLKLKKRILELAKDENVTLSKMTSILLEEALTCREADKRMARAYVESMSFRGSERQQGWAKDIALRNLDVVI